MPWKEPSLSATERITLKLRGLYEQFGYRKYHVSQFEEYGLYLQFKSFLTGGRILSFTDLDGRLLALKPDVTLSIAKNTRLTRGSEKSYYIENVYRESLSSGTMQEIRQMGLEYLGGEGEYAQTEVLYLALMTLKAVGPSFVLELSHMGFLLGLFDALGLTGEARERVLDCLANKSAHGVAEEAERAGIDAEGVNVLRRLCLLSGPFATTWEEARSLCQNERMAAALDELSHVAQSTGMDECLRLDFTLQGDMEYYDGLMMAGYISGVPRAVLYGGRYDGLMKKLGRDTCAVGFALYLDDLKELFPASDAFDVDVLLLVEKGADPGEVLHEVMQLTRQGLRVRVETEQPQELRCGKLIHFEGRRGTC